MATSLIEATTGQRLRKLLRDVGKGVLIPNPDPKRSNLGTVLHKLFVWQEIEKLAANELKLQWKTAQGEDGICDEDDLLRSLDVGESEICNSKAYALVVDIKTPAERIDGPTFYKALAKRFGTTVAEVERIAARSKVANKASLTKKVVERV